MVKVKKLLNKSKNEGIFQQQGQNVKYPSKFHYWKRFGTIKKSLSSTSTAQKIYSEETQKILRWSKSNSTGKEIQDYLRAFGTLVNRRTITRSYWKVLIRTKKEFQNKFWCLVIWPDLDKWARLFNNQLYTYIQ